MPSKIESCFLTFLSKRKIPALTNILVYSEYHYWAHQLDLVSFMNVKAPGQPKYPVNWEMDDPTHEEVRRTKKDVARDNSLMDSDEWRVRDIGLDKQLPPIPRPGWVIFRLPYSILLKCVNNKTYKFKSKHTLLISKVDELITMAWTADKPQRILWDEVYG